METAVLLSGGVDSSVALHELVEHGVHVRAFYLKIWLEDELAYLGSCPWEEDLEYARAVCDPLGVPIEVVPLQREYHERVVSYTVAELRSGQTPSPDVFCNQRIKFGAFFDAVDPSFERVASGHYARVERDGSRLRLRRSPDPVKDQTYFLSRLTRSQLERAEFPIGHLTKEEVRKRAAVANLATSRRKDSQGLCFLGKISFRDFVKHHLGERPGEIRDIAEGRRLGEHRGYWFHTIGQRRGLGLHGGPWYVVAKDIEENVVWVTHEATRLEHARDRFRVGSLHWIDGAPKTRELGVKIRHTDRVEVCHVTSLSLGLLEVELEARDSGVAPGQFAVFYEGDICLGSGVIAADITCHTTGSTTAGLSPPYV